MELAVSHPSATYQKACWLVHCSYGVPRRGSRCVDSRSGLTLCRSIASMWYGSDDPLSRSCRVASRIMNAVVPCSRLLSHLAIRTAPHGGHSTSVSGMLTMLRLYATYRYFHLDAPAIICRRYISVVWCFEQVRRRLLHLSYTMNLLSSIQLIGCKIEYFYSRKIIFFSILQSIDMLKTFVDKYISIWH